MPRDLFSESYSPFGDLPEDYPFNALTPFHPKLAARGYVESGQRFKRRYYVDLKLGECTCQSGHGWSWGAPPSKPDAPKWYKSKICTHKLRLMSSLVEREPDEDMRDSMTGAYYKAVSSRYNKYELVSAFHKELRRGDFEAAWFFGLILAEYRGRQGVIRYLLNILYEETRDHMLGEFLLECYAQRNAITLPKLQAAIRWFCRSKKKWQLPHRLEIFRAEMLGYELLAKEYSPDVAKGANIIDADQEPKLKAAFERGFKSKDQTQYQRGLKGLQKLVHMPAALDDYRFQLYSYLYDFAEANVPDEHQVWRVVSYVNHRIESGLPVGYHELNAIADALYGEPYAPGLISDSPSPALVKAPYVQPPLAIWPQLPLYAHDSHTWGGKALMRRFRDQLKAGAVQTDLDFRQCGAYFGVCFRMLAYDQHQNTEAAWETVKWPKDLWRITNNLWY